MSENVKVVFGLIGGLALFLYGMNSMSDALQKAAGERMKKILGFLTKNPLMGALAGALVTAVLQSSSATTVMVIGFVSAGLMSLPQGISVIFGANIGTTMTAQLMAFKISNYIYPIIFIGFILNFVSKKEKFKNIGMVIFSFGLLFEGIEIMGDVMKPLASSAVFIDLMGKVSSIPILGVLLGAVMTLVVQSSSATIAVLQNFASQAGPDGVTSVIGLTGAIPILLGDNIGTTITALLASIGQSKNAKRTAIAHSIFNISGTCVFIFIIPWFAKFVEFISPKGNEIDVISRQIANAHTTFNVVCTLVWLPLIPLMVKIVTSIIRGEDKTKQAIEPQYLDMNVIEQPTAAMVLVSKELNRLGDLANNLFDGLRQSIIMDVQSEEYLKFKENLNVIHHLQDHITEYITHLFSSGNLTEQQSEQTAGLLYVNNSIQRVAERCEDIDQICEKIRNNGKTLTSEATNEMIDFVDIVQVLLDHAMKAVRQGDHLMAETVFKDKKKMQKVEKQYNKAHLTRVKNEQCDASLTRNFSGMIYNFDRMADNCVGIAEEACDNVAFVSIGEDTNQTSHLGGQDNPSLITRGAL